MSAIDEKKVYHKLKHDLENWRELILVVDSVFKWEKMYFAGVIWGSLSLFYLLLWYMDFSFLTFISMAGLVAVVVDYVYPIVGKFIFKPENWSGEHENKYESICKSMVSIWFKLKEGQEAFFSAKEQRSAVFLVIVVVSLVFCAWLGSTINNLFLCYFVNLLVFLFPGLQHNGFVGKVKDQVGTLISSKIQQMKEKTVKAE